MKRPFVSKADARAREDDPDTVVVGGQEYELVQGAIVIFDDTATADSVAAELGVTAKHAGMKGSSHTSMSVVPYDK